MSTPRQIAYTSRNVKQTKVLFVTEPTRRGSTWGGGIIFNYSYYFLYSALLVTGNSTAITNTCTASTRLWVLAQAD